MRLIQTIDNDEFYPTPATLVKRMLAGIDWNMVQTVLEPSAGKGDILREVALATESVRHDMDIDCIEADASLRQVLRYNFSEERKDSLNRQQGEIIKNSGCPNAENRFGKWKQYNRDTVDDYKDAVGATERIWWFYLKAGKSCECRNNPTVGLRLSCMQDNTEITKFINENLVNC